jgi:hypothetical protein
VTVARYPLGGTRELRVTRARGLLFVAVHDADRCVSGPLAVSAEALDTLRSALADAAGETGSSEATDPERPATRAARSGTATP